MVKIIRKKKRLFEDDTLAAATTQPASAAPTNTAAPAPAPAPAQLQSSTLPAATTLSTATDNTQQNTLNNQLAPADNNQSQLLQQLQNQDLNQNQDQQLSQTQQAVTDVLKNMENTYWCIANNVPEMIKEKIPDFKPDNAEAAPIIKNWDAFKANPSEQTFNAFIDSFKTFGNNQLTQQLQQNVQESLKRKAIINFRSLLESRLAQANQDKFTENVCKYYF